MVCGANCKVENCRIWTWCFLNGWHLMKNSPFFTDIISIQLSSKSGWLVDFEKINCEPPWSVHTLETMRWKKWGANNSNNLNQSELHRDLEVFQCIHMTQLCRLESQIKYAYANTPCILSYDRFAIYRESEWTNTPHASVLLMNMTQKKLRIFLIHSLHNGLAIV